MKNNTATEVELLQASIKGSTTAFEAIVKKYQSLICAITYSATVDLEKSEELAHQAFIKAWTNLSQLNDLTSFRAWLCTIARNIIRNYFRDKKRDIVSQAASIDKMGDISSESFKPIEKIINKQQQAVIHQALEQIPEKYRAPLVLFYRQDQSIKKVAEQLELSEEAVKTQISRGRKMLKQQVAAMVETTISRTAPGKAFTTAVIASVAAMAIKGSAVTAASVIATTASKAGITASVTTVMSGVTAKIITAAAVVAVTVGTAFVYKQMTESGQTPEITNITAAVVEEKRAVEKLEITENEAPEIQEAAVKTIGIPKPQPTASATENTNPPKLIASKPVEFVHAYLKERDKEGEIWTKGDRKWRFNFGDIEKICDGKRVLVLDHRNKQASYNQRDLKQPEEILEPLMIADIVSKNFEPAKEEAKVNLAGKSCIARINPDIESEAGEVVFGVFEPDSNELLGTAWIDKQTAKLNHLEATESQGGLIGQWHYDPIDEETFSTKVPKGYTLDQGRYLSGIVTDANSNPVTDATIYVTGLFEGPDQVIITQTNKEGFFEYELKFKKDDWGIEFPVVIRAVSPSYPDMVAWTCILDPDVEVEKWPTWMPPIDPEVVVTKLEPRNEKVICNSIQALWLQFEPAGSISGIVSNKQGEPIQDAVVNANMHLLFYVNKKRTGQVFTNRFAISAKTNEAGYYKITGIPTLEGNVLRNGNESKSCYVIAAANGYFRKSQYIQNAKNSGNTDITFSEEKYCDFVLRENDLTIRGRVVDNYGNPLAHYGHVYYMEKGNRSWHPSSRLDGQGRFVIPNAPRADVIMIKKETHSESYGWQHDNKTKSLEFMPYPEKEFEFNIPSDVKEFDVGDLVLEYPEITAEIFVVDFEGNPVSFVECAFEQMGSKELLKDRYRKVTNEQEGKCIIENVPRVESGKGRGFSPISLRPCEKAPRKYRKVLEQFSKLTYYHLKYPGDYKHYIYELVLPRDEHRQDYRMRIYLPEGELLLEEG